MRTALFLAFVLALSTTVLCQLVGGYKELDLLEAQKNPQYQQALKAAVDGLYEQKVMRKKGVTVENAWSQVVAGMNYKFHLSGLKYCTEDPIKVEAVVYCDLEGNCSLTDCKVL